VSHGAALSLTQNSWETIRPVVRTPYRAFVIISVPSVDFREPSLFGKWFHWALPKWLQCSCNEHARCIASCTDYNYVLNYLASTKEHNMVQRFHWCWKNTIVSTHWDAAFEHSLEIDCTRHSHSYKFSGSTKSFYWKSLYEHKMLIRNTFCVCERQYHDINVKNTV
jgi:hypothetical protein